MNYKRIFWYLVSAFVGIGIAAYMIMLLYYNPYYHYELFIQREWFYIGTAVVLGIIVAIVFAGSFHQEKEYDELYSLYLIETSKNSILNKQNKELSDQLQSRRKEIDQLIDLLKEAEKGNSMLNESAASWEEEPPQPEI